MVETKTTIKENDTMKMPTMNFDFGPFTEPGVVTLSPYGIAVRSSKGEYLTYNAATGATVNIFLLRMILPRYLNYMVLVLLS